MSIRLQILIPMLIAIIGGIGLAAHVGLQAIQGQANVERVVGQAMDAKAMSAQIGEQFSSASAVVDRVMQMTNFIPAGQIKQEFETADTAVEATLARLTANTLSPEVGSEAAVLASAYQAWKKDARVALGLADAIEVPTLEQLARGEKQVRSDIAGIETLVSTTASAAVAKAGADLSTAIRSELTYGALVAGCGLAVLVLIIQRIAGPIVRITRAMQDLTNGRLDVKIPAKRGASEIRAMIESLVVFKDNAIAREALETETRSQNADLSAVTFEGALLQQQMGNAVDRAVNGDFSGRLTGPFQRPENKVLAANLNALIESFEGGINETTRVLSALADADLTVSFEGQHKGAFARLQSNANAVTAHLSDVISRLAGACQSVTDASQEILTGTRKLNQRSSVQAETVRETNTTAEMVAGTVGQNAKRASETSSVVRQTSQIAGAGSEVMQGAQMAMVQITDSASRISDIIGVIEDIAFQTNLLALNAGVEAARAGDSGKGFAVVATEVRALAQKTAQASNEVKALIDRSSKEVHQGADLVRKAAEQFSNIVNSIAAVSALSNEIATDSMSQSANLTLLTGAMRSLDQLITDNKRLVSDLTQSSARTSNEMEILQEIVSLFQLPGGIAASRSYGLRVA